MAKINKTYKSGDEFTPASVNEIIAAVNKNESEQVLVKGTLDASASSITLSNSAIKTNSLIEIYTSQYGLNPNSVTVSTGNCVLTFDSHPTTVVAIKIVGEY